MDEIKQFEPLWGSWRTEDRIGEGSYGKVYRAVREEFGQKYYAAIKHISIPSSESQISDAISEGMASDRQSVKEYFDDIVKNLMNEIKLMNQVKGKTNIVSYEDHLILPKASGIGYDVIIRMELLTCLNDVLRRQPFTQKDVIKLGIDMCSALEVCVDKGIVHRDIKPSNIFVSDSGDYKLGDFGVARELEHTTVAMSKKGTYVYMSPEVYRGEPAGFSADIYSLGMVMYRLVNGNRAPFLPVSGKIKPEDNEKALARRMAGEVIPAPAYAGQGLAQIILKATQFDRKKRYHSPAEMKKALLVLSGSAVAESAVAESAVAESASSAAVSMNRTVSAAASQPMPQYVPQPMPQQAPQSMIYRAPGTVSGNRARTSRLPGWLVHPGQYVSAEKAYALWNKVKARVTQRRFLLWVAGAFALAVLATVLTGVWRSSAYDRAVSRYNNMNYVDARSEFKSLGNYKLSKDYVVSCDYYIAKSKISEGDYEEAIRILEGISDFYDAKALLEEAKYKNADKLVKAGNYQDAKKLLEDIAAQKVDAEDDEELNGLLNECNYQLALQAYAGENYSEALVEFEALSAVQYKDSAAYAALCNFRNAKETNYYYQLDVLKDVFDTLLKYADTNDECRQCCADSLFTLMKMNGGTFSNGDITITIKQNAEDESFTMTHTNMWKNDFVSWLFYEERGAYGYFVQVSEDENAEEVDWFEVVNFDTPYSGKPASVTIKNPDTGKEYKLKRQK